MTGRSDSVVLIVEDDATMARLLRHLLEREGYKDVRHVWSGESAAESVGEADLVLLDQQLPDIRGLDLLPRLLDRPNPPAVIMITAHGSESLAAAALRLGADDYLTKDHTLPELLAQVVERARRTRALRQALTGAEQELVRAERLAAVGELSVTLHHELNNPLAAALAEVELALADASLADAHREGMETVRTALFRIRDALRRVAGVNQAGSAEYLGGLRMLPLEQDNGSPPYRGRAVVWMPDVRLARMLAFQLRHAGFEVERCDSQDELASRTEAAGVSLVVVGSDAAAPAGRQYVWAVVGAEVNGADVAIPMPFDPEVAVNDLLAAVERRAR